MEALLASEDYGKDLASVNNLLKKHQLLEADISAHEVRWAQPHGERESRQPQASAPQPWRTQRARHLGKESAIWHQGSGSQVDRVRADTLLPIIKAHMRPCLFRFYLLLLAIIKNQF